MIGFGEFRPAQENSTPAGRDANRRVIIVILAGEGAPAPADAAGYSDPVLPDTLAAPQLPPIADSEGADADAEDAGEADAGIAQPGELAAPLPTPVPVNTVTPASRRSAAAGTEPAPLPVTNRAGAGIPAQE